MDGKKIIKTKKFNLKKFLKKLIKNLTSFFKNSYVKFMGKSKLFKKICYCWAALIVVLLILLILLSNKSSDLSKYYDWEDKLESASIRYASSKDIYPLGSNPLYLTDDALIETKYLLKSYIPDESCLSYVRVYYSTSDDPESEDGEYVAKAYINCKGYTTEGYSDNK